MNLQFALPLVGVAAALGCFVFVVWESLTIGHDLGRREWLTAAQLAAAAFALRALVAVATYVLLPYGDFAPDELGYTASGVALSQHPLDLSHAVAAQGWVYFNAAAQQLFGDDHVLPRLWNAAVGSVAVLLCYVLATKVVGPVGARVSAFLLAFMPSLVLWSSLNLKDADVWCLILAGMVLIIRLQAGWRLQATAALGIVVVLLGLLRQFAAVSLLVAIALGLLIPHLTGRRLVRRRAGVAVLALLVLLTLSEPAYGQLHINGLATMRHDFAVGARSALDPDPGLQTLHGAIAFLPRGLVDLLIRPFPWEVPSRLFIGNAADVVIYYAILTAGLIGIFISLMRRPTESVPLVGFITCLAVGYGLVLANLGTSYRERAQILIVLCVFAGATFDAVSPKLAQLVARFRHEQTS